MIYTIKQGDTLYNIARAYNTTIEELVKSNGLTRPNDLAIGQNIFIPTSNQSNTYTVVSGDTMMNGYFQDDAVQDDGIYTDENGKKWIMTGDLGYKDKDGFLFFTGRKKRMIVISGYNVYPFNIESEVVFTPIGSLNHFLLIRL